MKNEIEKKKKDQNEDKNNRVIAPINFNPLLPKVSDVLKKHFKLMVFKKPEYFSQPAQGNSPTTP